MAEQPAGRETLLGPYRVLDLSDDKGAFCARLLGDLGADVIKIEPLGGDPSRDLGPFYHDDRDREKSLSWFAYNMNKRGITLDPRSEEGRERFLRLARGADFLVESCPPGHLAALGLDFASLRAINRRLIMVSITPFGQTGPYAHFQGPDIVAWALGGILSVSGDADRPPLQISFPQAYLQACAQGAVGALVALHHRERTGEGQHVDVSAQQAAAWVTLYLPAFWDLVRIDWQRAGSRRQLITKHGRMTLRSIYPCRDGYVLVNFMGGLAGRKANCRFSDWIIEKGGDVSELEGTGWPIFDASGLTPAQADAIDRTATTFLAGHTKAELYRGALERGILLAPLSGPRDLLADEQLAAREAWLQVAHPGLGTLFCPGPWAKLSATPMRHWRRPPLIGEHEAEVLAPLSGNVARDRSLPSDLANGALPPCHRRQPVFAGLKVVDFSWAFAGPVATRVLADHGACVVRVESMAKPDMTRTSPPFKDGIPGIDRSGFGTLANSNKHSVSVNLKLPLGRDLARRLVSWADVVGENFTPGTMQAWALDYSALREIKPDLIMFSASLQGQSGPFSRFAGYGSQAAAISGFYHLTGHPDGEPTGPFGQYSDLPAGWLLASALLAALDHRRRTGQGQYIDLSVLEASLPFVAPVLLECAANGREPSRTGNRHPAACPHGVFPCQGDDRWCAIAVMDDGQWQALCRAMGHPAWARDERFDHLSGRKACEDELEELVGSWTALFTPGEVMATLQAAGVPAGVVNRISDLFSDPQLAHRGHFATLAHPIIGPHVYQTLAYRLSESPYQMKRAAPCLGQDNEYVFKELLGLSDQELSDLVAEGVLY